MCALSHQLFHPPTQKTHPPPHTYLIVQIPRLLHLFVASQSSSLSHTSDLSLCNLRNSQFTRPSALSPVPTKPNMSEHTYKFNVSMSCGGCSGAVDRVLKKLDGMCTLCAPNVSDMQRPRTPPCFPPDADAFYVQASNHMRYLSNLRLRPLSQSPLLSTRPFSRPSRRPARRSTLARSTARQRVSSSQSRKDVG